MVVKFWKIACVCFRVPVADVVSEKLSSADRHGGSHGSPVPGPPQSCALNSLPFFQKSGEANRSSLASVWLWALSSLVEGTKSRNQNLTALEHSEVNQGHLSIFRNLILIQKNASLKTKCLSPKKTFL